MAPQDTQDQQGIDQLHAEILVDLDEMAAHRLAMRQPTDDLNEVDYLVRAGRIQAAEAEIAEIGDLAEDMSRWDRDAWQTDAWRAGWAREAEKAGQVRMLIRRLIRRHPDAPAAVEDRERKTPTVWLAPKAST